MTRRKSKEQSKGKGKLTDILEAIELEESPDVMVVEMTHTQIHEKRNRYKKPNFSQEEHGFIFRPRKPMRRSTKAMQQAEKMPEIPSEKTELTKKIHGKETMKEKSEEEVLQEQ